MSINYTKKCKSCVPTGFGLILHVEDRRSLSLLDSLVAAPQIFAYGPKTQAIELGNILHQFGAKACETGGHKISKTAIIRALVRVFTELDVDHTGVMDEDMLIKRIWDAIEERHMKNG